MGSSAYRPSYYRNTVHERRPHDQGASMTAATLQPAGDAHRTAGEIPAAAVLAAARVQCGEWFDDLHGEAHAKVLADMAEVLTAALPHLRAVDIARRVAAELERLADEMAEKQQWMREEDNRTIRSSGLGEGVRMVRDRAGTLRGVRKQDGDATEVAAVAGHSVYARFTDKPVDKTATHYHYWDTVNVDLDADGEVVGVEIHGAAVVTIDGENATAIPGPILSVSAVGDAELAALRAEWLAAVDPRNGGLPRDWRAVEVLPGTPYPDEHDETVPPGWYVMGGQPDDDDVTPYVLRVEQSPESDAVSAARAVAARLNGGTA
jgi:hypothetical protein